MALYVWPQDDSVMISTTDPDSTVSWDKIESEAIKVSFPKNHPTPLETEANIIRNKLTSGSNNIEVIMR